MTEMCHGFLLVEEMSDNSYEVGVVADVLRSPSSWDHERNVVGWIDTQQNSNPRPMCNPAFLCRSQNPTRNHVPQSAASSSAERQFPPRSLLPSAVGMDTSPQATQQRRQLA